MLCIGLCGEAKLESRAAISVPASASASITIEARVHRVKGAEEGRGHGRAVDGGRGHSSSARRGGGAVHGAVHRQQVVGALEHVAAEHGVVGGALWGRGHGSLNGWAEGCALGCHWEGHLGGFGGVGTVGTVGGVVGVGEVGPW